MISAQASSRCCIDWDLFEKGGHARVESLEARLENYRAGLLRRVAVPKSAIFSRPGALPVVDDWIVYTGAAVGVARKIEPSLIAQDQGVLFSFRWSEDEPVRTFRSKHLPFQEYRRKSVELSRRYPIILETDIASFFEHVDLQELRSTLARLGAEPADLEFLFDCLLPQWTHESGRGIPQGPWASSYIANALLDSVDKAMLQYGYAYIRYVDDMRVFCEDRVAAKRAVLRLTELVRELGLTLQTSKTRILLPDEARTKWRGFEDVLGELEGEVARELSELFTVYGEYFDNLGDKNKPN